MMAMPSPTAVAASVAAASLAVCTLAKCADSSRNAEPEPEPEPEQPAAPSSRRSTGAGSVAAAMKESAFVYGTTKKSTKLKPLQVGCIPRGSGADNCRS